MPKIVRKAAKIFGVNAGAEEIGQVGALRNGAPTYSKDPDVIQALANFTDGWFGIAMGDNSPAMEDMNGIQYVFGYQIAYLLQNAGAEWNAGTEYFINSICAFNGQLMVSLQDSNLNNNPGSSHAHWATLGNRVKNINADYTVLPNDDMLRVSALGLPMNLATITLPSCAATPVGRKITIKNVSPSLSSGTVKVVPSGSDEIDFMTEIELASSPPTAESITIQNSGTTWDII